MNIGLLSSHPAGRKMAGPGIRYYKIAKHLSRFFDVTLFLPEISDEKFPFRVNSIDRWKKEMNKYDVVITQGYRIPLSFVLNFKGKKIIDMYTPLVVEYLEHTKGKNRLKHKAIMFKTFILLKKADAVLVANHRQLLFYAGLMSGWNLISGKTYVNDRSLLKKFLLMPSGIEEKIPPPGRFLKERGIRIKDEFIFVWNGGLWRWFDPILPLKAIDSLRQKGLSVKLLFLGRKSPSKEEKGVELSNEVYEFAKTKRLLGRYVFFYEDWVDYEIAKSIIVECDAGLCTFRNTLEAQLSFRTRFLDYLECGIPVVWTDGDYFAELLKSKGGACVKPEDERELIKGMKRIMENPETERKRILELREQFLWRKVIEPLVSFLKDIK